MSGISATSARVVADGKFFRLEGKRFFVKGVTYGPFAPNAENEMFASREQTAADFRQIRELGANLLRIYYVPPAWFLDLAREHGLKVLVDIPWPKHLCFLDSDESQQVARDAVREAVRATCGDSAIFAYSVVNEISAEIVRWSGVARVERFIESLIDEAKQIDPGCLCTFTSFPPTEYLQPRNIDFVCFNVYLHQPAALEAYLARLQTLAHAKPLLLAEFGMDSFREGEAEKSQFLSWQIETAFRSGVAGTVVFSYTDDWYRGGFQIEDWAFGLTTRERKPKRSFDAVREKYTVASWFPLARTLRVSIVVATYNGARTLKACLESLSALHYPDYEVILVDDGSTDATPEIAAAFPRVRYIHQPNRGLSVARNTGIAAATGEVVAFTDDDCRADEDWLYYLICDLLRGGFVGVGGHNFLPPEDSAVAAAVALSPGGPAHVMLTDSEAEHIPGCNMAFYKWALDEIGGFDPIFRKAGDDVDICWRLQQRGYRIGFSPGGFVWHYRRSTIKAYLKQQAGYGEAEFLLGQRHPEHFNSFGGGTWRGRIYTAARSALVVRPSVIYHGLFGSAPFQRLYAAQPALPLMLATSLGYHSFILLPLIILSFYLDFVLPLTIVASALPIAICVLAAVQADLPPGKRRLRPLIALLFFLQPIVRGWARLKSRLNIRSAMSRTIVGDAFDVSEPSTRSVCYWSDGRADRCLVLGSLLAQLEQSGCPAKPDTGWATYDAEIVGNGWSRLLLTTATEDLDQGRKSFRCRLQSTWSLRARILFWAVALTLSIVVLSFSADLPEVWMLPMLLVILHWYLEEERQALAHTTVRLLDQAAAAHALIKL